MIRNYLKTAIRNLRKNIGFSAINIAGLAIGLCGSIFIFLWVQDELSYDRNNKQPDDIYRVLATLGDSHAATGPLALTSVLQRSSPAVLQAVRFFAGGGPRLVTYGEKRFVEEQVWYADSNFQQLFNFPLVKGDPGHVLQTKDGILITESMARKYFGDKDPMGQRLQLDGQMNAVVEGVLKDLPVNSHLQFDFLLPMSSRVEQAPWNNFIYYDYVRLDHQTANNPGAIAGLEKYIDGVFHEHNKDLLAEFSLQPLTAIHLGQHYIMDVPGGGSLQYVRIFSLVAVFVLMIACINFMNLSTAFSVRRAKEVGLRKTVGALRGQLIGQFLGEAVFLALIALALSVALVWLLLPLFNMLTGKTFSIAALGGGNVFLLLGIAVLAGLVAGSYPALVLSGFRPVMVLKGVRLYQPGRAWFRNGLVVLQFTIAIALMVGTIVVYRQLQFIQARDMGFDKSNLLYVAIPVSDAHVDISLGAKLVDQGLAGVPGIAAHTVVGDLPTDLTSGDGSVEWPGKDPRVQPIFALLGADENFLPTFGAHLLKGRFFSKAFGNEDSNAVVNETALKLMHMDAASAVGKTIRYNGQQTTIIGVVRDFNFKPVQFAMEPLLLLPYFTRGYEYVVVKSEPGAVGRVIPMLEKKFRAVYPDYPFSYGFVDQDLNRLYASDQRMGQLFNVFCILAVFISCLGLLGLSAYTTQRRAKEIGVRKVLGASVTGVVRMLAREFLAPVILAALIAFPLAAWAMAKWLDAFAYRVGLEWWIFAAAGVLALLIALGAVSFHAINAALSNPVKTLRSE